MKEKMKIPLAPLLKFNINFIYIIQRGSVLLWMSNRVTEANNLKQLRNGAKQSVLDMHPRARARAVSGLVSNVRAVYRTDCLPIYDAHHRT